jgi:carbamoyl-phosphate synthase large subunit
VLARIPTITTIAAAQAAADGIAAVQRHHTTVYALQELHSTSALESLPAGPK